MKNSNLTLRSATVIFSILMLFAFFSFRVWNEKPVIDWDISQYYTYLPATFIYQDYTFSDPDSLWHDSHFKFGTNAEGDTLPVKMTAGLSLLYAPFFLTAQAYASMVPAYEPNGFSKPYRFAILLSACLASIVAFWASGKFLMLFFPEKIAVLTTLVVFVGTNIPYYSIVEPMTHVYSLALASLLFLIFYKYLKRPSSKLALIIGILAGLITLVRLSNIVLLIFPLILLIGQSKNLTTRQLLRDILLAAALAMVVWIPQFIYWHYLTGQMFYYSYGEEGFHWSKPEIWQGLFSYRKGWFVYSPVLLLALPGIWWFFKRNPITARAAFATIAVSLYLVFSWWCWWYGGSFGARALIEYLPLVSLPLAAALYKLQRLSNYIRVPSFILVGLLCFWSLFMNWQYYKGLIHYDAMTKEVFWNQFLKTERVDGYWKGLNHPDYDEARRSRD